MSSRCWPATGIAAGISRQAATFCLDGTLIGHLIFGKRIFFRNAKNKVGPGFWMDEQDSLKNTARRQCANVYG
jgi:hypothetical protein